MQNDYHLHNMQFQQHFEQLTVVSSEVSGLREIWQTNLCCLISNIDKSFIYYGALKIVTLNHVNTTFCVVTNYSVVGVSKNCNKGFKSILIKFYYFTVRFNAT